MMGRFRGSFLTYMIPRKKSLIIKLCFVFILLLSLTCGWFLSETIFEVFLPSSGMQHLEHFRWSRNLKKYIDNIEILIEPSSVQCKDVPLLILVASSPHNFGRRDVIRRTWGAFFPTFFVMGLNGGIEDLDPDNYIEAKYHSDIITYNFHEHYQNLTLKVGLMLHWSMRRCSPNMLFKTDDDVMVNPLMMKRVLEENPGGDLVGYRVSRSRPHRSAASKWRVPRWLYAADVIPHYLSGTGYLLRGKHINAILTAAYEVPMINLEDVYFTYLVANRQLNLTLGHERRLSPYKPWFKLRCVYFGLASLHSLGEEEMETKWRVLEDLVDKYSNNRSVCDHFLDNYWSEWFLY